MCGSKLPGRPPTTKPPHCLRLLFAFLLLPICLGAQHAVGGLAGTQVQYLERRVPGFRSATDSITLTRMRQRLVNLPILADATFTTRVNDGGGDTTVSWELEEARTVFPLLSFGGLKGNLTFLLGVKDINWRGRGNSIEAYYQYTDGEHGFYAAVTNPSLSGSNWGYYAEARRYAAREPLYFPAAAVTYRYANLSVGVGGSYSPRYGRIYRLGVNVFTEDYLRLDDIDVGPAELSLTKFLLKVSRDDDRRDYFGERQHGSYHTTIAQTVLTDGLATPFLIAWHDFRQYVLVGYDGNLAARLRLGISTNDNTPFAPFVVDSQFNIRGIGNRIDRGTAQVVLNVEYRHTFYRDRRRRRFVTQAVVFSDLGTWRNPGGGLSDLVQSSSVKHFVGAGLRLASPKVSSAVVRIDYGVDITRADRGGFVLGYGQFF